MAKTLHYDFANDRSLSAVVGPTLDFTRATTATYVDASGLIATAASGEARFTHDKDGNSLGLLVEEARTNICLQSEDLLTTWTITNAAPVADQTTAPDGSLTADQLIDDSSTGTSASHVNQSVTVATSTVYAFSVFAKADQLSWLAIELDNFTTPASNTLGWFDLGTGAVGTIQAGYDDSGIEDYGNGWYRCWVTFTTDAADTTGIIRLRLADADSDTTVALDGSSSIFVWGAQLEAGAFPTSYIPTTTTSETRNSDQTSTTDLSWWDSLVGTFYGAFTPSEKIDEATVFALEANSSNQIALQYDTGLSNVRMSHSTGVGDSGSVRSSSDVSVGSESRAAFAVAEDDMAGVMDGGTVATDTTVDVPISTLPDTLIVGADSAFVGDWNGTISEIRYYDERLDNDTLLDMSNGIFPADLRHKNEALRHQRVALSHQSTSLRHKRTTLRHEGA
jgi:hypothetical protein